MLEPISESAIDRAARQAKQAKYDHKQSEQQAAQASTSKMDATDGSFSRRPRSLAEALKGTMDAPAPSHQPSDETIIDLSHIHNLIYTTAESQGVNSQEAVATDVKSFVKKVQANRDMWFDLIQRCSKSLLGY